VNSAAANTNPSGKTNKMILINHPSKNTRFNSVPSEFGFKSHCASMHLSSLVLLSLEIYIFSLCTSFSVNTNKIRVFLDSKIRILYDDAIKRSNFTSSCTRFSKSHRNIIPKETSRLWIVIPLDSNKIVRAVAEKNPCRYSPRDIPLPWFQIIKKRVSMLSRGRGVRWWETQLETSIRALS